MYKDKEQQRAYQREWDQRNKSRKNEQQRERLRKLRIWWEGEILPKLSCAKCDENHPGVLDFHHTDPSTKEHSISFMLAKKYSKESIFKEVGKCEVLCSNCHRKHHYKELLERRKEW